MRKNSVMEKPSHIDQHTYSKQASMEKEVTLFDLWCAARRGWRLVLAGPVAGAALAVLYILIAVPTYESRATIQIGKVHDKGALDDFGSLSVQLMDLYGPESDDGNMRELPYLKQIIQPLRMKQPAATTPTLFRLVVAGRSPDEARTFLTKIVGGLMQGHEDTFNSTVGPLRQRLAEIDGQIDSVRTYVNQMKKQITRLGQSNAAESMLATMERSRLQTELTELERERALLKRQIANPYSMPTTVIASPSLPSRPATPRKPLVIAVGIILGLIVAFLLAILRNLRTRA